MGKLGRATRVEFTDGCVIDTPVEVAVLRGGTLRVSHSYKDDGVKHSAVSHFAPGQWKSFDLETYTLVINNLDDQTTKCYPGLSTCTAGPFILKYLMKSIKLKKSSALARTNELMRSLETEVSYSGFPRLSMKLMQTPEELPVEKVDADTPD